MIHQKTFQSPILFSSVFKRLSHFFTYVRRTTQNRIRYHSFYSLLKMHFNIFSKKYTHFLLVQILNIGQVNKLSALILVFRIFETFYLHEIKKKQKCNKINKHIIKCDRRIVYVCVWNIVISVKDRHTFEQFKPDMLCNPFWIVLNSPADVTQNETTICPQRLCLL